MDVRVDVDESTGEEASCTVLVNGTLTFDAVYSKAIYGLSTHWNGQTHEVSIFYVALP